MNFSAIGTVHSSRKKIIDDNWDHETSFIKLGENFSAVALAGLADFSHAEILFHMHQVDVEKIETAARHPRNNKGWPLVGIFAQRGKNRPNQIGLSVCEILKVEGDCVYLKGLDAVDGTPVLDIKPWLKEFGPRGKSRQPEWSSELMKNYWQNESQEKAEIDMFDPIALDTKHVKIRHMRETTWQKLAAGILYDNSFHATNWGMKTADDIRLMYERWQVAWKEKLGNPIVFLSFDEKEILGMTSFMNVEPKNKMLEIGGTWINPKFVRTYVNTETKFALLQYCFEVLKLNRVEFRIDFENVVSQRAIERLGVRFDGVMPRRKINATGSVRDYQFYSVTDLSWPAVKTKVSSLLRA